MPILPPANATVYDTVNTVMNSARVRLNDEITTLLPTGGRLVRNNQVFSQQVVNNAWRKLQEYLGERGYARLINEIIIFSLPPCASTDPGSQTWLNWSGYFDGANFWEQPALPGDFSHPIKIWERWSGNNAQFGDPPMEKILDGLPATLKTTNMRFWEWRGDTIYMPGSQMCEDLRIRYINFLADFADVGEVQWFEQPVPIVRVSDAFSWFICAELAAAKGEDKAAEIFMTKGEAALNRIFNLDVRADQRVNIRRRPRSGRGFGREYY